MCWEGGGGGGHGQIKYSKLSFHFLPSSMHYSNPYKSFYNHVALPCVQK